MKQGKFLFGLATLLLATVLCSAATIHVTPAESIQTAIDGAISGDTIELEAGTYNQIINLNKFVHIVGVGSEAAGGTVLSMDQITAGDSRIGVIQLNASGTAADPLVISGLRIEVTSIAGISVGRFTESTGTSVSNIVLQNVKVMGTNTSPSTEQERGLYVDLTSSVDGLIVSDCEFSNLTYGWYFQKAVSADTSNVTDVVVSNSVFNHNNHKGIYVEKLSEAVFTDCVFDSNGFDSASLPSYFAPWSCGVDVNLKAGSYSNIAFYGCTVTNNAIDESKEGAGMSIKGRDDGATYGAFPASLDGVVVFNCLVTGNERGIRLGEPGKNNATPTNVVISNCDIYGNVQQYSGSDGSAYGDVINASTVAASATNVWWGSASGPAAGAVVADPGAVSYLPFATSSAINNPLALAGTRLVQMQRFDGGWAWPLVSSNPTAASPLNTVGPIAQGLAKDYLVTRDPAMLDALEDAGDLLLSKTNYFSPSDGYLALQLDLVFGGTAYRDHVIANYYDLLAAGTYDSRGAGTLYSTQSYVDYIDTARAGQGYANLAAWDIGMGLVGAASCGVSGSELDIWIQAVKDEIDELDGTLRDDVLGLAGAIYALAYVGEDFDPTAGEHAAASSLADLAGILVTYQLNTGGFAWNSLYVIEDDFNENVQETSYAILALAEVDPLAYRAELQAASTYMKNVQLATGGWESYVGSGENNEITGEALWGITTADSAVLSLVPNAASIYIQPGESIVVDMDVSYLTVPVIGCQAMLGYSSAFFADPTGGAVQAGGGAWEDLVWDSWRDTSGVAGDIDTVIWTDSSGSMGTPTSADATIAKITLTSLPGVEGTTQMVFRQDVNDGERTFLADEDAQDVIPVTQNSTNIYIDGTDPVVSALAAIEAGIDVLDGANVTIQGVVDITVDALDAFVGLVDTPTIDVSGPEVLVATLVDADGPGFGWTVEILPTTANGTYTITITATDKAGNDSVVTGTLEVNKNQITGLIELQDFVGDQSRDVVFVADGGLKTWTMPVSFPVGSSIGAYTLTDVPDGVTALSAKTAWNLRVKLESLVDVDGQIVADFIGSDLLHGGDANNSNSVNILDFAILKGDYGSTTELDGDFDGSGQVGLDDFIILKQNWFTVGDAR